MCVCACCEIGSDKPVWPLLLFLFVSAIIMGILIYFSWVEQCEMGNELYCQYIERCFGSRP
jgi:hypothetical protein